MSEAKSNTSKKIWFWLSIIINVGFLGVFKYYNFFATSFSEALSHLGFQVHPQTINIILPVGISFYTFHGLSYVIDIYKNRIPAERNFIEYAVFVSYFPLLVAGPIERATHLLPQIKKQRTFDYAQAVDGLQQILWGLFKKIVIADNCAKIANVIFDTSSDQTGSTLLWGAILFAFQIYGDFSGYSDIALGTSKLLGINLLKNFSYPYFSRDIAEFWRRWHISLSSWFKDYLYIPLGGSKGNTISRIRNTFIIFLVSGFWHGANWTFIIWGLLNALFIMPSIIFNTNRNNMAIVAENKYLPSIRDFLAITVTFFLTVFAWIFFRAENVSHAFQYTGRIFSLSLFSKPAFLSINIMSLLFAFVVLEWLGRKKEFPIQTLSNSVPVILRHLFYYTIILMILYYSGPEQTFIYFQF